MLVNAVLMFSSAVEKDEQVPSIVPASVLVVVPEDCKRRDTFTHEAWVSLDKATVFFTMSLTDASSEVAESYE